MVNAIGFDKADARAPLEAVRYMKAETRYLRRFDDFIKFELLLIILSKEPEPEWNIARYLNAMTTAPQSDSRMNHFVRDMIRMGARIVSKQHKRTSKHLHLCPVLRDELTRFFAIANGHNTSHPGEEEKAALLSAFQFHDAEQPTQSSE